jgi:hypothetical protein
VVGGAEAVGWFLVLRLNRGSLGDSLGRLAGGGRLMQLEAVLAVLLTAALLLVALGGDE